jgi:AcrR family transcriptional regulator
MATTSQPAAPAPGSRRERLRAEARAELVAAARGLMAEHGAAGVRVGDITARADMALGSFYNHFTSKDEAVAAVVTETVTAIADAIVHASHALEDPAEAMSVGIKGIVGLGYRDPELAQLLVGLDDGQERFEGMVWSQALAVISDGVDRGRFTVEDPALVLTMAEGAVLSVLRRVLAGRAGPDADVACAALLLRSVGLTRAEAAEVAARPLPELVLTVSGR